MKWIKTLPLLVAFLLVSSAKADFGNWFVANKRLSTTLDSPTKKLSYRFTCQENMTLSAIAVYFLEALTPCPSYQLSLQEDEKSFPTGTPLSSCSYVPQGHTWSTLPMDAATLIKGKVYHIVLEVDMMRGGGHPVGSIGSSNQASFLSTDVLNHMHPNDGSPDPKANTLFYDGSKWKTLDQEPVYALYGVGSKFQGDPYDDPGARPIYGKVLQGQSLHFHCGYTGKALAFRIRKRGDPSTLKYQILVNDYKNHSCKPLCPAVLVPHDQVASNFQWVTVGIPDDVQRLFRSECWFFVFQTDSGRPAKNEDGCEDCYLLSDLGNSGGPAKAADLTFDGGPHLSRAVLFNDASDLTRWLDQFERDSNVGVLGPPCPVENPQEVPPIPTPLFLENEPRHEP